MRQDTADYDANRTIQMKVKPFYLAAGALVAFLSLTTYGLAGPRRLRTQGNASSSGKTSGRH